MKCLCVLQINQTKLRIMAKTRTNYFKIYFENIMHFISYQVNVSCFKIFYRYFHSETRKKWKKVHYYFQREENVGVCSILQFCHHWSQRNFRNLAETHTHTHVCEPRPWSVYHRVWGLAVSALAGGFLIETPFITLLSFTTEEHIFGLTSQLSHKAFYWTCVSRMRES